MEKEISSGAMLGIVLIALAAIIGIGFGIFAIAKGTANEGITGVQDSLNSVSESGFDDYNQKTVTGSSVKSAITNYKGKSYAILVNTQAMNNGQKTQSEHKQVIAMKGQNDASKKVCWVNFNALFSPDGENFMGDSVKATKQASLTSSQAADYPDMGGFDGTSSAKSMAFTNGTYITEAAFVMINGNIQYDTATGCLNTSGDCLNIPDNTKFKANLIKDSAGVIKGIVFEQQTNN